MALEVKPKETASTIDPTKYSSKNPEKASYPFSLKFVAKLCAPLSVSEKLTKVPNQISPVILLKIRTKGIKGGTLI